MKTKAAVVLFIALQLGFADPTYSFARKVIDSTGGGQETMALGTGDLDNDGRPDVVVGGQTSLVWYHATDWTRRTISTGTYGEGSMIVVRDIDGDGRRDVLTGETLGGVRRVVWFRNTTAGWLRYVISSNWYGHDFAFGDVDKDGLTDVVALDQWNTRIVWLRRPADPKLAWSLQTIETGRSVMGLALADVDRDGRVDVVAGRAWYRNTGTTWPRYAYTTLSNAAYPGWNDYAKVTVTDLNADGRLDVFATVFAEVPNGRAYAFLAPADPKTAWTAVPVGTVDLFCVHSQAAANFDGSGRAQIAIGESNFGGWSFGQNPSPQIYLYRLVGSASSPSGWEQVVIDTTGTHELQAADFDGDGRVDLAGHWENTDRLNPPQNGPVHWWQNLTGTAPPPPPPPPPPSGNLAPNPGFESDPNVDYYTHGTAAFSWAGDAAHGGTRSVKTVSTQAAGVLTRWMSRIAEIPATAGTRYTASAWMKTAGVTDRAVLAVTFWNSSQQYLGVTATSAPLTGTTAWTQLSLSATAPAGTASLRVEFRLYGPGTLWTDDVFVGVSSTAVAMTVDETSLTDESWMEGSADGPGGSDSDSGRCGATGAEVFLVLGSLALLRRRAAPVLALLLIASLSFPAEARRTAAFQDDQVVLVDALHTHTKDEAVSKELGTSSKAFSYFALPAGAPSDWRSPVDFAGGTLKLRLEVVTKPSDRTVSYQACVWQRNEHACSSMKTFKGPGVYEWQEPFTSFWHGDRIDWTKPLAKLMLVVKDANGNPVDDRFGFGGKWAGTPDFSLYYPMTVRFTAVVVGKGARYDPNALYWRVGGMHFRDLAELKKLAPPWARGQLGVALQGAERESGLRPAVADSVATAAQAGRVAEADRVAAALRDYAASRRRELEAIRREAPVYAAGALRELGQRYLPSTLGKELLEEARNWGRR